MKIERLPWTNEKNGACSYLADLEKRPGTSHRIEIHFSVFNHIFYFPL